MTSPTIVAAQTHRAAGQCSCDAPYSAGKKKKICAATLPSEVSRSSPTMTAIARNGQLAQIESWAGPAYRISQPADHHRARDQQGHRDGDVVSGVVLGSATAKTIVTAAATTQRRRRSALRPRGRAAAASASWSAHAVGAWSARSPMGRRHQAINHRPVRHVIAVKLILIDRLDRAQRAAVQLDGQRDSAAYNAARSRRAAAPAARPRPAGRASCDSTASTPPRLPTPEPE